MDHMLPEIPREDFRKGAQWFSMKRQHAVVTVADNLYYSKFRDYCGPGVEGNKNCIADEHYLPTFFYMLDPTGIANWTVTYVDWSERKWHPRKYMPEDITLELIKNISVSSPHRYDLLKSSLTITMLGSNEITNQYAFWSIYSPLTQFHA